MNPQAWTETLEQFALEGRLGVAQLVTLGIVAALLLAWFAWRESRLVSKPKACWILYGLRMLTLLVVLWTLAEPTDVLTTRKHQPKTVGIFLDTSASMTIADPGDGSGDRTRWEEALTTGQTSQRRRLDKALGALTATTMNVRKMAGDKAIVAMNKAIQALTGLQTSELQLDPEHIDQLTQLRRTLSEEISPAIEKLASIGKDGLATERQELAQSTLLQLNAQLKTVQTLANFAYERRESATHGSKSTSTQSRLNKATNWLAQSEEGWVKDLGEDVRVERYHFSSESIALGGPQWTEDWLTKGAEPSRGTNESSWIQQATRLAATQHLNTALVITDGVHNTGDSPRDLAPSLQGMDTMIVSIGDTRLRRDVFLHHVKYPQSVIKKDTLVVEALVSAHDCQGEKLVVQLLADEETVLDQQVIQVGQPIEDHRISLKWKSMEIGPHDLTLQVKPVKEEFSEENNHEAVKVNVIDDELRVLLAESLPRWEFRYLKSILKRDRKIQMDSALFKPQHIYPGRKNKPKPPHLPENLDEWSRYRLVVLGDLTPEHLTPPQQELLRQYVVEAGGNLVIIAGESMPGMYFSTPLGDLFPVQNRRANISRNGYGLTATAEGSMAPPVLIANSEAKSLSLWEEVSRKLPVYDLSPYSIPKPTAHVLIEASNLKNPKQAYSYLSWQYVGKGRVVYLSAPAAYQLRYRRGDEYHYRFWGQLFRWALARELGGGSKTVRLGSDKTRYPYRSEVDIRLRLRELNGLPVSNAESQLFVKQDDRLVQTLPFQSDGGVPGAYQVSLTDLPPGKIQLEAQGSEIDRLLSEEQFDSPIQHDITIDPHDSAELRVPLADTALLRSIADASGGVVLPPAAIQSAISNLDLSPTITETVNREPLWNRWFLIWLIVALLLAEWIGRKVVGLV